MTKAPVCFCGFVTIQACPMLASATKTDGGGSNNQGPTGKRAVSPAPSHSYWFQFTTLLSDPVRPSPPPRPPGVTPSSFLSRSLGIPPAGGLPLGGSASLGVTICPVLF